MEAIWRILILTLILALSSFVVGVLPLSFAFSNKRKNQLSTLGNGLLLGAALGIIIPEGIESVSATSGDVPTATISLSLLVGFALMLVIEQYLAPHTPGGIPHSDSRGSYQTSSVAEENMGYDMHAMDVEISSLRHGGDHIRGTVGNTSLSQHLIEYPLTLGLIIHSLADGLALGASAVSENSSNTNLSLVVFFALMIHKSPTALALTASLLSTSLPRSAIRKHVALFSIATPLGALSSYALLSFVGAGTGRWPGIALLISGGTFLYVATVIQPIGTHPHGSDPSSIEEFSKSQRLCLLILGIFLPFTLGSLFSHGHEHVHTH